MIRKERDWYRWHRRFAVFPRKIGEHWIWLEAYAWRNLRPEEYAPMVPFPPRTFRISSWQEFTVKGNSLTRWREKVIMIAIGPATVLWHRPPMTPLKVVGIDD